MKILAAAVALAPLLACGSKEPVSPAADSRTEPPKPAAGTASAKPSLPLPPAEPKIQAPAPAPAPGVEPDKIKVQHCLIGFKGSVRGKPITRTQEEAKALAYDILDRAKNGEDFDGLVKKYTDDSHPGIYGLTNTGKPQLGGYYARTGMVPAFGNVGFKLAVGEVGIADHDAGTSPFGWHVIKRVE